MKVFARIIFVFLLFLWCGGDLFAINTAPPIDTGVPTSLSGSGILSGCSREAVQSLEPDSILSLDCTRIVCKGNFWGKSATDVCVDNTIKTEGSGENARTYKDVYIRRPSREQATEAWRQKRFYLDGSHFSDAFNLSDEERQQLLGEPNTGPSSLFFLDILFSEAIADSLNAIPWTQWEKQEFANVLYTTAVRIESAFTAGSTVEIGSPDPNSPNHLLYLYSVNALYAAQFLAHALRPDFFSCPAPLLELCALVDDVGFTPYWADLPVTNPYNLCQGGSIVGLTYFLQGMYLIKSLKLTNPPETIGYAASVAAHEAWHNIFHYFLKIYTTPASWLDDPYSYFINSSDSVLLFEDETTARYIASIIYHFLPEGTPRVASVVPCASTEENLYNELRNANQSTVLNDLDLLYVSVFFQGALTNDEWDSVQDCVNDYNLVEGSEPKYLTAKAKLLFTNQCIVEVMGVKKAIELFQKLEDQLIDRGGPCVIPKTPELANARPCLIDDADLWREKLASSETKLEELLESEPPPSNFNWQNPGNQTVGGEDPGAVPDCVANWQQPTSLPQGSDPCYDWCWNNFPNGDDGGICKRMTRYDAEQGSCDLSSGSKCENKVKQMCAADLVLNKKACEQYCLYNNDEDFCSTLCASNSDYVWCPQPPNQGQGGGGGGSGGGGGGGGTGGGGTGGGTGGCQSGWTYPQGNQILYINYQSCYPYVGTVKCCGSSCEPMGNNMACLQSGYCGCPSGPYAGSFQGYCTIPETGYYNAFSCMWCDGTCICSVPGCSPGTPYCVNNYQTCACNYYYSNGQSAGGVLLPYEANKCMNWQ